MNGFCGDSAYTFCVGEVDPEVLKLLKTTKEALYLGIENAIHGKRLKVGTAPLSLINSSATLSSSLVVTPGFIN